MSKSVQTVDFDKTGAAYYAAATVDHDTNTIYISGQAGIGSNGLVPNDYESQINLALLQIRKILIAASAPVNDILKLTLYIVNYDANNRKHTKPIQQFLGSHRPAITLVPVSKLAVENWLFEIDAIVAKPVIPRASQQIIYNPNQATSIDVVIVGAGLAGLTAADEVVKAGFSCLVLEARDRVGGRTFSQALPNGHGMIDLGAAWLNRTNQWRIHSLAKRFGAELIEQNTNGKCVLQDENGRIVHFEYGDLPKLDDETRAHLAQIRDMVEHDCQKMDQADPRDSSLDSITFASYLRDRGAGPMAASTAAVWTRAMLGQEPEDISALFFLHYCKSGGGLLQMRSDREHGGQFLRVRQGTQYFAKSLAASLPRGTVQLSSPVTSVHKLGSQKLLVSGPKINVIARKVVSAVPLPLLSTISFTPALPPAKFLLASTYKYGFYKKAMLSFRNPIWVEKGFCGLVQSFSGPISIIRDTSIPADSKHILTCFMAGKPGLEWSKLSRNDQQKAILEQIGSVFGEPQRVIEEFEEFLDYDWIEDGFSGYGCPSPSLPPGVLDCVGDSTRTPVGDIHFVGTETARKWKGYMEGAVESGERGAKEVISTLGSILAKI